MLSVSGLRGVVGASLTPPVAARYGAAVGHFFKEHGGDIAPKIVVGRDSRPSGEMIELATVAGLIAVGCRVIRLGIVTTPATAVMTKHLGGDGGLVITASHNPVMWNGIKTLRSDGSAPSAAEAAKIAQMYRNDDAQYVDVQSVAAAATNREASQIHLGRVLSQVDAQAIRDRQFKVVLDSVHGAGGPSTAMLLQQLDVQLVHLHAEPTGRFPHAPEPTRENLVGLCDAVAQHGADVGFAQDPDADRLALADETGRYVSEEYTLALACQQVLGRALPQSEKPGEKVGEKVVVANLSTSRMIDDIAEAAGGRVVRTPVGEGNVAEAMQRTAALIGGEGNGGVVLPQVSWVRDSLAAMALILQLLAATDRPMSSVVGRVPAYAMLKEKIDLTSGMAERLQRVLCNTFAGQQIDLQDGVRIDWPDRWVHVRPSNTEPIVRIIAEAADQELATQLIKKVSNALAHI